MYLIPVKDHQNWFRDSKFRSFVCDESTYQKYMHIRQRKKQKKTDYLQNEVNVKIRNE